MRINTLYLNHFGCFHKKCVELQPGINVIYGANEAGKSTVHRFIQAMLFGVERLRGKAAKKDEYARFQPWDAGKNYEGSMEIEYEGKAYRLIRNFYREDEYFKVEQLETGKEIHLAGQQMDALIEGLTRSNFKNTLSISQMEARIDQSFGLSLQTYMANVQRTKSQAIDLEKTLDYLKKERKNCLNSEAAKQLNQLKSDNVGKEAGQGDLELLNERIAKREKELSDIKKEIQVRQRSDKEHSRQEQKERLEAVRLIEENNAIAEQYQKKKAEYDRLKSMEMEEDFDSVREQWNEANENYEELADRFSQMLGRNMAILFSIMIFGLIPVVAIFFLSRNTMLRMAAVGIFILVLLVVEILLRGSRKHMKDRLLDCREQLQEMQQTMEKQMLDQNYKMTRQRLREELYELRDRYEKIQIPLQPYLEKYGEDISLDMDEGEEDALEFLRDRQEHLMKSLERLLVQKETMEQAINAQEEQENEIRYLAKEVQEQEEQAGIIDECMRIIQELSEDIHSDFGPALNREVSRMMNELTLGRYERVVVDNELNLKVDTGNGYVSAEQLSTGTKEQLYLALRLAMVNLIYPEKNMPILFDDSFVYYDDTRLGKVLEWLAKQNYEQILIFTCQRREIDALDAMGIAYHNVCL